MTPARRAMDEASHAHKREADLEPRMHHRACDDPDRRFEWHVPDPAPAMSQPTEDPRARYGGAVAVGALVGSLAGCLVGALLVLCVMVLWI